MTYNKENFASNNYKYFYFEVRDERGRLQATFSRRYEAEKYAEETNRNYSVHIIEQN